ncbi:complex I intermediate-associated protein 30 (CIA30) [Kordia periserrulae]|uniref:Complex I intermediate-associated protein 30 (CIA30) n=1 Tax=Kordia periserrulae TaxID=701523 RepID=A0A2T6BYL3_9FLAO|nr:CIA30 family protein [Kordia periserrulae]PTX61152.1 complex I intermediate-associated protein 30 (CIA30) [Kordia periserrulae]
MNTFYTLCFLLVSQLFYAQQSDIDFGKYKDGERWQITNDGVMGGLSQGDVRFTDNGVVFSGMISLENNGGFSSYRSQYAKRDLSSYKKIIIRYRSKNYAMGFTLEMDKRWYVPYYKADLPTTDWKWEEKEIKFSDFVRYNIGRKRSGKPTQEELANILRIGFISNEKKAGPFKIEIDYIKFE